MSDNPTIFTGEPLLPAERASPFRILDLPPELISVVCNHSCVEDLLNIRCTCRTFDQASLPTLGPLVFSHLKVILHPVSLAIAFSIANTPRLSKYVERVSVSGERLGHEILAPNGAQHRSVHDDIATLDFSTLVLRQVFESLPELRLVDISRAIWWTPRAASPPYALACGRTHLLGPNPIQEDRSVLDDGAAVALVYETVLPLLPQVDPEELIELDIGLCINPTCPERLELIKLDSEPMRSIISNRAKSIVIFGAVHPGGIGTLLSAMTDIRHMDLRGIQDDRDGNGNEIHHTLDLTGPLCWPGLRRMCLYNFIVDHDSFLALLHAHHQTLEVIWILELGFHHGTWRGPIELISTMTSLHCLHIHILIEQYEWFDRPGELDDSDPDEDLGLEVGISNAQKISEEDNRRIRLALHTLLSDFRTTDSCFTYISEQGTQFRYRVDLRKAVAAAGGLIEERDGL